MRLFYINYLVTTLSKHKPRTLLHLFSYCNSIALALYVHFFKSQSNLKQAKVVKNKVLEGVI